MYEVNGQDISTLEFDELKFLISCDASEVCELANSRLLDKETNAFNSDVVFIYKQLQSHGLIEGHGVWGGYVFECLTPAGRTFIDEFNKKQDVQKKQTKDERAFQIKTIVLSCVLSIVASVATSFLMSLLLHP